MNLSSTTTCESIQHMNRKPATGPTYGILLRVNEMTTEVKTMTILYAEVAIAVSMPV